MDAKIVFSSFEELKIQDISFTDPIRPKVIVVGSSTPTPVGGDTITIDTTVHTETSTSVISVMAEVTA